MDGLAAPTETRFSFGSNWQRYLSVVNDERIGEAERSLKLMLEIDDLAGLSFLDVGCGSGLFSLAARRLGARVFSFDVDEACVQCTLEIKRRYLESDRDWTIQRGSILSENLSSTLGQYDIVYSWGVLHHTGEMWKAIENVSKLVARGGKLFIAIYNHQGITSERWRGLKYLYNRSPKPGRVALVVAIGTWWEFRWALTHILRMRNPLPFTRWAEYKKNRGMSYWYDLVDWIGGYPFEVAKPEEVFEAVHGWGFELVKLKTCGGTHGCNEFVFQRSVG